MKLKFTASRPQGSAVEGVQKCVKNVFLMWVSALWMGEFTSQSWIHPLFKISHTGRSIGQLRPTHTKNLLFIFSQCTHTHPHCPVPTSLDSVMTTIQQSMMLYKWG